jgi:ATP adenylyltransferase/5',5'''-P-1,P-4-tetraphosphate phosphorylase II
VCNVGLPPRTKQHCVHFNLLQCTLLLFRQPLCIHSFHFNLVTRRCSLLTFLGALLSLHEGVSVVSSECAYACSSFIYLHKEL